VNIDLFNKERQPSTVQLESVCELFKRATPEFDEQSKKENSDTCTARARPDDYRKLLETKTLLLITKNRDEVTALLEWDSREKDDVTLAYITWILVAEENRGQGLASLLHTQFEEECMPNVIRNATSETIYQALGVHLKNPAIDIYRKWGYDETNAPQWNDGRKLFMVKSPPRCIT